MISNIHSKARVLLIGALAGLYVGLSGCTTTVAQDGYYHHPVQGWYDYYYYPSVDIYLDISAGYYWYRDHDHWTRVKRLPAHLHPHDHERVFLRLDSDRPQIYHQEHRKRYREAPQRRDDRHGQDQRREYVPDVSPGHVRVRDASHAQARDRSSAAPARTTIHRAEPTPPTARRQSLPRAAGRPANPVRKAERISRPDQTADTATRRANGIGSAPGRKGPPPAHEVMDHAHPAAQASERDDDAGPPTQRRSIRGRPERRDSDRKSAAARDKQARQSQDVGERRRGQPRTDDMNGPRGRAEQREDGVESGAPPRPPGRRDV